MEWVAISSSRESSSPKGSNPHLLHALHWQEDSSPPAPPGKHKCKILLSVTTFVKHYPSSLKNALWLLGKYSTYHFEHTSVNVRSVQNWKLPDRITTWPGSRLRNNCPLLITVSTFSGMTHPWVFGNTPLGKIRNCRVSIVARSASVISALFVSNMTALLGCKRAGKASGRVPAPCNCPPVSRVESHSQDGSGNDARFIYRKRLCWTSRFWACQQFSIAFICYSSTWQECNPIKPVQYITQHCNHFLFYKIKRTVKFIQLWNPNRLSRQKCIVMGKLVPNALFRSFLISLPMFSL